MAKKKKKKKQTMAKADEVEKAPSLHHYSVTSPYGSTDSDIGWMERDTWEGCVMCHKEMKMPS